MNTQTIEPQQVTLKQLKPFYGPVQAVQPVDVTIRPRSVTAIIGPSGCGKSTVLRCINRMHETIAFARVEGQVLLLDEPCSALDPVSTYKIEELLVELKQRYTIVIVTHNMQQAARIADRTMVFMVDRTQARPLGVLVEEDVTNKIFTAPRDPRTEEYISGRVG